MRLSQVLNGDWVITSPSRLDATVHVEFARFNTGDMPTGFTRRVVEESAAHLFVRLASIHTTDGEVARVESHRAADQARMTAMCEKFGFVFAETASTEA